MSDDGSLSEAFLPFAALGAWADFSVGAATEENGWRLHPLSL
jgi:hypothetical protein